MLKWQYSDFSRATLYSFDDGTEPFSFIPLVFPVPPPLFGHLGYPSGHWKAAAYGMRKIRAAKYYDRHVPQPIDRKSKRKSCKEREKEKENERVVIYAGLNTRHRMEVAERINGRREIVESEALHSAMLLARPPR